MEVVLNVYMWMMFAGNNLKLILEIMEATVVTVN